MNLTPVSFRMSRECQVKKERKERSDCLAHRYYFYFLLHCSQSRALPRKRTVASEVCCDLGSERFLCWGPVAYIRWPLAPTRGSSWRCPGWTPVGEPRWGTFAFLPVNKLWVPCPQSGKLHPYGFRFVWRPWLIPGQLAGRVICVRDSDTVLSSLCLGCPGQRWFTRTRRLPGPEGKTCPRLPVSTVRVSPGLSLLAGSVQGSQTTCFVLFFPLFFLPSIYVLPILHPFTLTGVLPYPQLSSKPRNFQQTFSNQPHLFLNVPRSWMQFALNCGRWSNRFSSCFKFSRNKPKGNQES